MEIRKMSIAMTAIVLGVLLCATVAPIEDIDAFTVDDISYFSYGNDTSMTLDLGTDWSSIDGKTVVITSTQFSGSYSGVVSGEIVTCTPQGADVLTEGTYELVVSVYRETDVRLEMNVLDVTLKSNNGLDDTITIHASEGDEFTLPGADTLEWESAGEPLAGWSENSSGTPVITEYTPTSTKMNVLYAVYDDPVMYTVTIQSDGNGTVSPGSVQVAPGTTVTVGTSVNLGSLSIGEEPVTTTPAQGFEFDMWTVASGEYNGGTVTGDMTITAVFSKIQYEIAVTGTIGGEIESSDGSPITVDYGTQITVVGNVLTVGNYPFEAIADGDHEFEKWTVAGGQYDGGTVTGDMTITAVFVVVDPDAYSVTVQTVGDGTAFADPTSQIPGEEVTLSYVPGNGNEFKEWQVISGGITIEEDRFTMGNQDVIVKAIFVPIEYDVTVDPVEGGTVTVSTTSAEHGSDVTVTVVANDNKVISDIVIGYPTPTLGAISPYDGLVEYTYVIEDVTSEVVVSVTFRDALLYHILLTESGEAETFDVYEGRDMTVPVEPPFGYIVGSAKVDGESIRVVDAYDFVYTFEDIRQNHTLAVTFTIDPSIDDDEEESPITPNPDTGSDKGGKDNTVAIVAIAAGAVVAALVAVFALRKD